MSVCLVSTYVCVVYILRRGSVLVLGERGISVCVCASLLGLFIDVYLLLMCLYAYLCNSCVCERGNEQVNETERQNVEETKRVVAMRS